MESKAAEADKCNRAEASVQSRLSLDLVATPHPNEGQDQVAGITHRIAPLGNVVRYNVIFFTPIQSCCDWSPVSIITSRG